MNILPLGLFSGNEVTSESFSQTDGGGVSFDALLASLNLNGLNLNGETGLQTTRSKTSAEKTPDQPSAEQSDEMAPAELAAFILPGLSLAPSAISEIEPISQNVAKAAELSSMPGLGSQPPASAAPETDQQALRQPGAGSDQGTDASKAKTSSPPNQPPAQSLPQNASAAPEKAIQALQQLLAKTETTQLQNHPSLASLTMGQNPGPSQQAAPESLAALQSAQPARVDANAKNGKGQEINLTGDMGAGSDTTAETTTGAAQSKAATATATNSNGQQGGALPDQMAASLMSDQDLALAPQGDADFASELDIQQADTSRIQAARGDVSVANQARAGASHAAAVVAQISERLLQKFDGGSTRFEIRLDPAELGEVDVRVEVDRDGRVQAVLAARDPAAVDAIHRGLKSLENALAQAGLDLGENGVRVELDQKQNSASFAGNEAGSDKGPSASANTESEILTAEADQSEHPLMQTWSGQRLDVRV